MMRRATRRIFGWTLAIAMLALVACVPPPPSSQKKEEKSDKQQAMQAFEKGELAEALKILERLARTGDPEAQLLTARIYQLDRGGVPRNDERAATWFEHAASQGIPAAQLRLAEMLERGAGRPADQKQAFIWATRAEQAGMPGAPETAERIGARLSDVERRAALAAALAWAPRSLRPGVGSAGAGTGTGGAGSGGSGSGGSGITF